MFFIAVLNAIRAVIDPWLGTPAWKLKTGRVVLAYRCTSEGPAAQPLRLKIEINSREHFSILGIEERELSIQSRWFRGAALVKTYCLDDHREDGVTGLLTIVGVKYTTARDVAEKAVDRALTLLDKAPSASRSGRTALVGGDIESFDDFLAGATGDAPPDVLRHLVYTYGSAYPEILKGDRERIVPESPVLAAEVRHAVREEMAWDLESIVLRRTELGTAGHPGRAVLEACAAIAQSELGWSAPRKHEELEGLDAFYRRRS